ncbi:MAG TPA: deoxyguanosinetriphosphate triphosphohydrolase [Leptospiraceae bacterium]|nr:deoxyguanosinetriphosphate triphosphohydrolase [Spirochaetaceae bacterium]HBS04222.1 deoxyguanosinetriphosphate triphosphohydrolase [Leptospiraceae bacterium]|tara:strand:- start:8481 stop:9644 length:1164 start_codon:yes stop_codon:yes gene_type:complete
METLENLEHMEDANLAVYAVRHGEHAGRLYEEDEHPFRTALQRDRDRVLHSKAFRRLGYKTQVFVNSEGDNYRTRLTHSLEVAQISRSVARSLSLNADYAETLSLAHDLGHTPFGHAGQDALHRLMQGHGGFEHNCQSLRIVSALESRYPSWPGLNLTRITLAGMMKHGRIYSCDGHLESIRDIRTGVSLEARLVDLCDRIAYLHHDLEDGLDSGYLTMEELSGEEFWIGAHEQCQKTLGEDFRSSRLPLQIRTVVRSLLNECLNDLIINSHQALQQSDFASLEDVLSIQPADLPIGNSAALRSRLQSMHAFLKARLYMDPSVKRMSFRGERMIEHLFKTYMDRPDLMPSHVQERINAVGLERVIADYISGMTDRFAEKEYRYLTGS